MIDTEALRKKVIDLAIQGKLTEQLHSDGDAESLYAQIQEEKAKLIKEGKIKKEKQLISISDDEIPFDIPSNWKWVRLASIGDFISGYTPSNDELYDEGNIPYFKVSDMNSEGNELYLSHTVLFLRGDSSTKQFRSNTIVYPKNGGALLTNKKRILAQNSVVDLNTGGFMPSQFVSIGYAYLLFLSIDFQDYHKGSAVPTLDMMKMRNTLVPLPPYAEQERIVESAKTALECVDDIKIFQLQYEADLSVLKSKIIDAGIRGKLSKRLTEDGDAETLYLQIQEEKAKLIKEGKIKKEKPLPEIDTDEIPFEIPNNWKWVRLGDICSKISSGNTPTGGSKGGAYVEKGFCFFREQNIYNDGIHNEGMVFISEELLNSRPNSTVLAKDILLNITGGSIGRCALIPDDFSKGSTNQHILIIRPLDTNIRFYVHQCLCSPYFQSLIMGNVVGDKDGFSAGRCKNAIIPIPPLEEQKRITETIDELLQIIE